MSGRSATEARRAVPERWVLVIDDDVEFRDALSELLRNDGLCVRTADRATAAIRELQTTEFDAVLSDLIMPGNGHLVVDYVNTHQPGTPVIVISSHESARQMLAANAAVAFACLRKPVHFDAIRDALARVFELRDSLCVSGIRGF